jgi:hypothetical protein
MRLSDFIDHLKNGGEIHHPNDEFLVKRHYRVGYDKTLDTFYEKNDGLKQYGHEFADLTLRLKDLERTDWEIYETK